MRGKIGIASFRPHLSRIRDTSPEPPGCARNGLSLTRSPTREYEDSIAELCRREGIFQNLYFYRRSQRMRKFFRE
jgi:hypothetical protein